MEPLPVEVFERLVEEALDALPVELGVLMENVEVTCADRGEPPDLLGLYQGVPLTDRESYGVSGVMEVLPMPDQIVLYRLALCEACSDIADLRNEVGVTVIHEVAHHFGIDDDRLIQLGWD